MCPARSPVGLDGGSGAGDMGRRASGGTAQPCEARRAGLAAWPGSVTRAKGWGEARRGADAWPDRRGAGAAAERSRAGGLGGSSRGPGCPDARNGRWRGAERLGDAAERPGGLVLAARAGRAGLADTGEWIEPAGLMAARWGRDRCAQIAVIHRWLGERVKSIHSRSLTSWPVGPRASTGPTTCSPSIPSPSGPRPNANGPSAHPMSSPNIAAWVGIAADLCWSRRGAASRRVRLP
jgi:hypothetical protein